MSECRSLTNFIGNAVATIVVAKWEGGLDSARLTAALDGRLPPPGPDFEAELAEALRRD